MLHVLTFLALRNLFAKYILDQDSLKQYGQPVPLQSLAAGGPL